VALDLREAVHGRGRAAPVAAAAAGADLPTADLIALVYHLARAAGVDDRATL